MVPLWADLPFVLALGRAGTLSGAARLLKMDRTTISRRIEQLEDALNEPLFDHFGGRFSLTSYGRQVFAAAESAEQELAILEQRTQGQHSGRIRVSLPEDLSISLAPCFHEFALEYPHIILELTSTYRIVDLYHFEADVALRFSSGNDGNLLTRKIGKPILALYRRKNAKNAALRYIARPGETDVPEDVLKRVPNAKFCMTVDGVVATRELIAQGLGIGILPCHLGDSDMRIERCSDPLPEVNWLLSIVYRPEQRRLRRIIDFVTFVEDHLLRLPGFDTSISGAR
ncbi:MAG: LysR family transcriptional regulator [Alphaproteobacteria bacterium]